MKKPLLTICIPTYNGGEYLIEQINRLLPQLTNETELIIRDNYSQPSAQSILSNSGISLSKVKIIRNNANIGADRNIFESFANCESDWLIILSDNDIVKLDFVKSLLDLIMFNNDVAFINYYGYSKNLKGKGFNEFCKKVHYTSSFTISNCLYNMKFVQKYSIYYKKFIDTHQAQTLFLFKFFEENRDAEFLFLKETFIDFYVPTKWSKLAFIEDTDLLYLFMKKYLSGENYKYFRKTVGVQVMNMKLHLLTNLRESEGLDVVQYCKMLFKIIKRDNIFLTRNEYTVSLKKIGKMVFRNRSIKSIINKTWEY